MIHLYLYVLCAQSLQSCPTLCALWTIAHQVPLFMGFSQQEYWNGLHFVLQGIFLVSL